MTLTLGWGTGELDLRLHPGADFVDRIELQVGGAPTAWPVGTAAWLQLTARGTDFDVIWPATVAGPVMAWSVPAAEVAQVPRRTFAVLWLDYPDAAPIPWLEGWVGADCARSGFGGPVVAVPGTVAGAVAVPVPGPPGPPGDAATARVSITGTAAITLSGHAAVHRNPDGTFEYASATAPEHIAAPIGVTTGAVSAGGDATVVMLGEITESSWSWTPGPVFLGVGGGLVQTLPSGAEFLAVIGTAVSPTTLYVNRQPSIDLT